VSNHQTKAVFINSTTLSRFRIATMDIPTRILFFSYFPCWTCISRTIWSATSDSGT